MLFIKDTTGTQTDCPKPLSRKKLKQLMPRNSSRLTAKELYHRFGRMSPLMKRDLERAKRESEAAQKEEKELMLAGVPPEERGPEKELPKPSIFRRMSGFFAGLKQKSDRAAARGK